MTKVVSVQYSEINLVTGHDDHGHPTAAQSKDSAVMNSSTLSWRNTPTISTAPRTESMKEQDDFSDAEQKRRLRLATEAAQMEQDLLQRLRNLSESEREKQLEKAKQCSEDFLQKIATLPSGQERVLFLQSVTNEQKQLLAIHKLWANYMASQTA